MALFTRLIIRTAKVRRGMTAVMVGLVGGMLK